MLINASAQEGPLEAIRDLSHYFSTYIKRPAGEGDSLLMLWFVGENVGAELRFECGFRRENT